MAMNYYQSRLHELASDLYNGVYLPYEAALKIHELVDLMLVLPYWPAIDQAINVLNEAIAADPDAMDAMLRLRIRCNPTLGAHPSIQCFAQIDKDEKIWDTSVTPFGLINGLFGTDESSWGHLSYTTDDNEKLKSVQRTKES